MKQLCTTVAKHVETVALRVPSAWMLVSQAAVNAQWLAADNVAAQCTSVL